MASYQSNNVWFSVFTHAAGYIVQWDFKDGSVIHGMQVEFTLADRQHMLNLTAFLTALGYAHKPDGDQSWRS